MKDKHETEHLAQKLLNHPIEKGSSKSRAFKHQKQLPLPKGSPPAEKLKGTSVIAPKSTIFEQKYCVPNQNYPLIHLEALKQRRISTEQVKEKWIATRHFRDLSHQMQHWIHAQMRQRIHLDPKISDPLSYLVERREERHFQIDRIIKYLSN